MVRSWINQVPWNQVERVPFELAWMLQRQLVRQAQRLARRPPEKVRLAAVKSTRWHRFWIFSSARNAGDSGLRCRDSVHRNRHDRDVITRLYVEDAFCEGTCDRLRARLEAYCQHRVQLVCRRESLGGAANNLDELIDGHDTGVTSHPGSSATSISHLPKITSTSTAGSPASPSTRPRTARS